MMGARAERLTGGELELDLARHEVRYRGSILKLEPHAMDLLIVLMERGGELVTREEIAERLWRSGTHVAADEGINTAVRKLRKALDDSPRHPRFLLTVVGRGYRFLVPVERRATQLPPAAAGRLVWGDKSIMLVDGDNVIGRDSAATVCLESSTVSRRHAVVRVNGATATLEDLRSKNGTRVNGVPVGPAVLLSDGDQIDVGGIRVVFVRPSQSARTRTLPA